MADYQDLARITTDQREDVRRAMDAARTRSQDARAALVKAREDAAAEGADLTPGSDAFTRLDDVAKAYSTARQEAAELEFAYKRLLDIDGDVVGATVADGVRRAAEVTAERDRQRVAHEKTVHARIAARVHDEMASRGVLESYRTHTDGDPLEMISVKDVLSRDEVVSMLRGGFRAATGDNVLTGASDTSAGALVWPEESNIYVDLPFRPIRVTQIVPTTTTDSDTVEYVEETAFTNAADTVAEATNASTGALPESALTLAVRSVSVYNVGHFIPATTRSLADAGQLAGILERKLVGGVRAKVEDKILSGSGSSDIQGLYTAVTQTIAKGAGESRADAVHRAITTIASNASVEDTFGPNAVVLHLNDIQDVRLEKDANGNYVFGGPTAPLSFPIWGLVPAPTNSATSGTPLVGAFAECQLWVREGLSFSTSDNVSDWWLRNIVAAKAQIRVAFKTLKAGAFCEITAF